MAKETNDTVIVIYGGITEIFGGSYLLNFSLKLSQDLIIFILKQIRMNSLGLFKRISKRISLSINSC